MLHFSDTRTSLIDNWIIMDDNYVDMASDPLHLQLMLERRDNPDSTANTPTDTQSPIELDTTCQQDALASNSHSGSPIPAASTKQPSNVQTHKDQQAGLGACSKEVLGCSGSKGVTDIKQCWDRLKFSRKEGKLSDTAEFFSQDAKDCVMSIIDFFAARLNEINQTAKSLPIRTKQQEDNNYQDLNFLKTLTKSLDEIPVELIIHIPEIKPLKDQIIDNLQEDLFSLQSLCYNRINLLRKHSKMYRKTIDNLKNLKKTRSNEMMILGEKPLPDRLIQTDVDLSVDEDLGASKEPVVEEADISSALEPRPPKVGVTFAQTPTHITDLEEANKTGAVATQNIEMENLSGYNKDSLTTIEEEVLTVAEENSILHFVGRIVNDSDPPQTADEALSLLNDKLGLTLTTKTPNIVDVVSHLYRQKVFFRNHLTGPTTKQTTAVEAMQTEDPPCKDTPQDDLQSPPAGSPHSSLSQKNEEEDMVLDTCQEITCSPYTEDHAINETVYYTAEGPSDRTSTIVELDQTPKRATISSRRPIHEQESVIIKADDAKPTNYTVSVDSKLSEPTIQPTVPQPRCRCPMQCIHNPSLTSTPAHALGDDGQEPDLDYLLHGQETDETHIVQGEQTNPKSAAPEEILEPTDISFSELNNLHHEEQREYLGERIFHYVKRKVGKAAPKITGMILSLPKNELFPGVRNTHVLDRMIVEANECIEGNPSGRNAPPNSPDAPLTYSNRPNDNLCNDYTAAMFQEVSRNPSQSNNHSRYDIINQSFKENYEYNMTQPPVHSQPPPRINITGPISHQAMYAVPMANNSHLQLSNTTLNPNLMYNTTFNHPSHYYANNGVTVNRVVNPQLPVGASFNHSGHQMQMQMQSTQPLSNQPFNPTIQGTTQNMYFSNPAGNSQSTYQPQVTTLPGGFPFLNKGNGTHLGNHHMSQLGAAKSDDFLPASQMHKNLDDNNPNSTGYQQKAGQANCTHDSDSVHAPDSPSFGIMAIILRDRKEFSTSTFLIHRIISQLSNAPMMNSQQLTDILSNMKEYNRSLEKFEDKISRFTKTIVNNKREIDNHNSGLYNELTNEIRQAERLSSELQFKLQNADQIIGNEKITVSHTHTNTKDLLYKEFSAGRKMGDPHIYEFLKNLENNFKISRTPEDCKAQVLKNKLKSTAKLAVTEDMTDYKQICNHLLQKFGDTIEIIKNIHNLHEEVGKIPSKYCPRPPWQRIEEICKMHLQLIRKAECLTVVPDAWPAVYRNAFRNSQLIDLMSHEWSEDLRSIKININQQRLYLIIVERFEFILTTAATNMDTSAELKREKRKPVEKVDLDSYALSYGEKRTRNIVVGNCLPQDCNFCSTLQRLGKGKNYFSNHLLVGPNKKTYPNNCPNYLAMTVQEKNNFIFDSKFCQFCLRPRSQCNDRTCGDDHLIRLPNGRKKGFVCAHDDCKNRVELCLHHKELNRSSIETRMNMLSEKYSLDTSVATFSEVVALPLYPKSKHPRTQSPNHYTNPEPILNNRTPIFPARSNRLKNVHGPPHDGDNSILFIPDNNHKYNKFNEPGKGISELDQPLLVDSPEELLADGTQLLAKDCKSIFIYSKIQGTTRALTTLFDCGGGSSLTLDSVPGRQLPACKGEGGPICLQGIGSGSTVGKSYVMSLPLIQGGRIAIEAYAVPEILAPLSKVDLSPALRYMKSCVSKDNSIDTKIKEEIQRASIFRFIEGCLDLLLGVKLLKIFPEIVHTLPSGLSIYRMKLKPASNAKYCLGGPYHALQSLHSQFPHGALMFHEVEMSLAGWRENSFKIIHDHSVLHVNAESTNDESDYLPRPAPNEEIIMTFNEISHEDCTCKKPLISGNELVICCNKRVRLVNVLKTKFLTDDRYAMENADKKPYKKIDWLENTNETLHEYMKHTYSCHCNPTEPLNLDAVTQLKDKVNLLIRTYDNDFQLSQNVEFLKDAENHLIECMQQVRISDEHPEANTFVVFQLPEEFKQTMESIQNLFIAYFPMHKDTLLATKDAHLTLLALSLNTARDTTLAKQAFSDAWMMWLNLRSGFLKDLADFMPLSFKGVEMLDSSTLYLKPSVLDLPQGKDIKMLQDLLLQEFLKVGITCDKRFVPHVTFARILKKGDSEFNTKITELLEEVEVQTTRITQLDMISIDPHEDGKHPCLCSLTFPVKNHAPKGLGHKLKPINQKEKPTVPSGSTGSGVETKNL